MLSMRALVQSKVTPDGTWAEPHHENRNSRGHRRPAHLLARPSSTVIAGKAQTA
jgi:hypothetical protein